MDETLVAASSVMYSEQQSRVSDKVHSYESRTGHKAPAPPVPTSGTERGKVSTTSTASSSSGDKEEQLYSQVPKEVDKSKEAILMASDRLADAGKAAMIKAVDTAISVDGPAVGSVRVNRDTHFFLRTDIDRQRIDVNVLSPSKKPLPMNIERVRDENAYMCPFVPKDVGSHKIHVSLDGATVLGSPFTCRVYDPERIAVSPITDTAFPQTMSFTGRPTCL
jgi:hypothetical protein